jgi:hypothetical protein
VLLTSRKNILAPHFLAKIVAGGGKLQILAHPSGLILIALHLSLPNDAMECECHY